MSFYLPPKKNIIRTSNGDPVLFYYWPFPLAPLFRHRVDYILQLMGDEKFTTLLDVGYGSGLLFPELARRTMGMLYGADIHGKLDAVYHMLEKEGIRNRIKLYQSSVTNLPFEDNMFDCTVGISVLEHVEDVNTAVKELKRVTKLNGKIYLGFPVENILLKLLFIAILLPNYHKYHPSNHTKILDVLKKELVIDKIVTYPFSFPVKHAWYIGTLCHKES